MSRLVWVCLLLVAFAGAVAAEPVVFVASPWEHVLRSTPPGEARAVTLQAAANEYEPCRIIVHADTALPAVSVRVTDLTGPAGRIPAANFTLYREYYLNVFEPSYRSTAPAGWYPDALIPFVDPATGKDLKGAKYDADPFDVAAGDNQGYWLDLYVPHGTAAGTYTAAATVTSRGRLLARVPITLTVWGFGLPDTIAMESSFGGLGGRLAKKNNLDPKSPELQAVEDLYIQAFLAHRAVPGSLGAIWPTVREDGSVDDSQTGARLRRLIEKQHVNALNMPLRWGDGKEKCQRDLRAYAAYLRQRGWLDLAYVYMRDEPNDAEEYQTVRDQGAAIRAADPGIRRMCTEQTVSSNPAWGDLYGAVDIWCPLWGLWDEKTARERQALGEKLWSYTALCQRDAPFWQIDFAPVNFRAPFWISWHYGIRGFLYWSSIYWDAYDDVWNKPHFRDKYWGEGLLVYPGVEAGIRGPVPSIRLKLIREALEDYEYMALAAQRADKGRVDAVVGRVAKSFQNWEHDPAAYSRARQRLAELLR